MSTYENSHIYAGGIIRSCMEKDHGADHQTLGISSYSLRAAFVEIQVPLPNASYWVKVRYGRERKTKLPQNYTGPQTVEILKKKFETEKHIPVSSPIVLLTREIEND